MKRFNFWNLLLIIPIALGSFVAFSGDKYYEAEKAVFSVLRTWMGAFDIPARALTELGSAVGVIAVCVLILIVTLIKRKYFFTFGLPVIITSLVSRIINITLKNLLDRPRPDFKVLEAGESSFPSGHAQNNMALYIALLLVTLMIVSAPKWRIVFKISFVALPIIIGITRIYFGVHYVSDVLAGFGIGALVAVVTIHIYFSVYYKIKEKKNAKTRI